MKYLFTYLFVSIFVLHDFQAQTVNILISDPIGGYPDTAQVSASYTNAGFTTVSITLDTVNASLVPSNYDVLIVNEYYIYDPGSASYIPQFLTPMQRTQVESFILAGGHVVWIAENWETYPAGTPADPNHNMIVTVNNVFSENLIYGGYFDNAGIGPSGHLRVHPSSGPVGLSPQNAVMASGSYATLANVNGDNAIYTTGSTTDGNLSFDPCLNVTLAVFPAQPTPGQGTVVASTEVGVPFVGNTSMTIPPMTTYDSDRDSAIAQMHFNLLTNVDMTTINSWLYDPNNYNTNCSSRVLPEELLTFDAQPLDDQVVLTWEISTDVNSNSFEIQRSEDGLKWETIEHISVLENAIAATTYEHVDTEPLPGKSYYRLRLHDADGGHLYSNIKHVYFLISDGAELALYPNPTMDQLRIYGSQDEVSHIAVFNAQGIEVTQHIKYADLRATFVEMDVANLNAGLYILKTRTKSSKFYKK